MSLLEALDQINKNFSFRKECEVGGAKFELGLLSLGDEQRVSSLPAPISEEDETGLSYVDEIKKAILSYAIKKINGEELPDVIEDGEEKKEKSLYLKGVLDRFPGVVIGRLFDIYVDLKEFADKEIEKNTEYEWFKTPEKREQERKEEEAKRLAEEKAAESETSEEDNVDNIDFKEIPKEEVTEEGSAPEAQPEPKTE